MAEGYNLNVKLTATSGENDAFTLALDGHPDVTLGYTMTLTKTTVKLGEDGTENTTEPNSAVTVSENPTVLTIPGGTADSSGSSTLTFAMVSGQLKQYSGSYTGTVTFTVSVTEDTPADSGGDSDNPGGDSDDTGDTGENP